MGRPRITARYALPVWVRTQDCDGLTRPVEHEHVPGHRVRPPRTRSRVQDQPGKHRSGQHAIDERDTSLALQDWVPECSTCPGFRGRKCEHHDRRHRGPHDARCAVVCVMTGCQRERGLRSDVDSQADERDAMSRSARSWRCSLDFANSQSTTVLAPISMRLSSPKPASATERGSDRGPGQHADPHDVPCQRGPFQVDATSEQPACIPCGDASVRAHLLRMPDVRRS